MLGIESNPVGGMIGGGPSQVDQTPKGYNKGRSSLARSSGGSW
jgi:hypothetical protein